MKKLWGSCVKTFLSSAPNRDERLLRMLFSAMGDLSFLTAKKSENEASPFLRKENGYF